MPIQSKPKLVFFQYRYDKTLPEFLLNHKRDHVKCLAEFFDVTVVNENCDYQRICDTYEPDLTLFESGLDNLTCAKPKIMNTRVCPHIPKLGLHNADAFSGARAGFLSDMDHWGIETFFAISTTAAEHTPEIANNLFVWPNFVDAEIYRDYGTWKSIPVLLTGNTIAFYPWRHKIFRLVSKHFPSLLSPHPGYEPGSSVVQFMCGENYARTINASSIVPACGTVAKEVVRKHFEIPACRACLVAEKSPALEAAGFLDMQNCIFADDHDVLDKLAYLFRNPQELERITNAGYRLVHSRHTIKQRDEIRQWFNLYRNLRHDQKIIQVKPFESLIVVSKSEAYRHSHVTCNGLHLILIHQGNENLRGGRYEEAEKLYMRCLNYMQWMPEAQLGLALCNLYKGNAKKALSRLEPSIFYTLEQYKAIDPDPVEWAYFIICFLCLGKPDDAFKHASQFSWLHHPELDRTRWVANVLKNRERAATFPPEKLAKGRWTIHPVFNRNLKEWVEHLCIMLTACGQCAMADTLEHVLPSEDVPVQEFQGVSDANREIFLGQQTALNGKCPGQLPSLRVGNNTSGFFKRRLFYRKLRLAFRQRTAGVLHRLETRYGYFLPYHLSEMRNDEFYRVIWNLAREEEIRSALLIGAARGKGCTEAFLAGALENENNPVVFCISGPRRRFPNLRRTMSSHSRIKKYELSYGPQNLSEELENTIKTIKQQNQINCFDVALIDSSVFKHRLSVGGDLNQHMDGAKLILLDDINSFYDFENHHRLLRDPNYLLVANNPGLRNGYAIFRRSPRPCGPR